MMDLGANAARLRAVAASRLGVGLGRMVDLGQTPPGFEMPPLRGWAWGLAAWWTWG
jgi:hypothetical protein